MLYFFEWSNVINSSRREILFEHRNKLYGAYLIRRNYSRTIVISLLITIFSSALFVIIPMLSNYLNESNYGKKQMTESVILDEPPPIDKSTPPPPVVEIPPP